MCLFGLGEVTQNEIDEHGLGEARRLVFERDNLVERHPDIHIEKLIVDGTVFRKWRDDADASARLIPKKANKNDMDDRWSVSTCDDAWHEIHLDEERKQAVAWCFSCWYG